jgi:hypothetical protein
MTPGQLRVFTGFALSRNGRMFIGGQHIVLLRPESDPNRNRRWFILIDGAEEICDEVTIERSTIETR